MSRTHLRSGSSSSTQGATSTLEARRGLDAQRRKEAEPRGWNNWMVGKHEGNGRSALFNPPLWDKVPAAFFPVLTEKPGLSERFRLQV